MTNLQQIVVFTKYGAILCLIFRLSCYVPLSAQAVKLKNSVNIAVNQVFYDTEPQITLEKELSKIDSNSVIENAPHLRMKLEWVQRYFMSIGIPKELAYLAFSFSPQVYGVKPFSVPNWGLNKIVIEKMGLKDTFKIDDICDDLLNLAFTTEKIGEYLIGVNQRQNNWAMASFSLDLGNDLENRLKDLFSNQTPYKDKPDIHLSSMIAPALWRNEAIKIIFDKYVQPINPTYKLEAFDSNNESKKTFKAIAKQHKISAEFLCEFNPWALDKIIHKKTRRKILIPVISKSGYYQDNHENILPNDTIQTNEPILLGVIADEDFEELSELIPDIHIVSKNETLFQIARSHRTSIDKLMQINGLKDPNKIKTGQVIKINEDIDKKYTNNLANNTLQQKQKPNFYDTINTKHNNLRRIIQYPKKR